MTTKNQTANGIVLILLGTICLCISDALAKSLSSFYAPVQLIFLRTLVVAPFLLVFVWRTAGAKALRSRTPRLHLFRGACNVASACLFYLGLRHLALAEATVIAFLAPILVVVLSAWVLRERVLARNWLAVFAGFGGVLFIVDPGAESLSVVALYPLGAAAGYAVMMISANYLDRQETMSTMLLYLVISQLAVSALFVPFFWTDVQPAHWLAIVGIGVASTAGLGLITQAFRTAASTVIAPFDYAAIIWASLIGWFVWNEVPTLGFYAGAALIVVSGIYNTLAHWSVSAK
ncbi:MAG: Riboflavin transporter [Paracidovorax wautersii]|uniref:Riboflavin transporter n=1 Tax=Paracidovorax wautersii TaxID=1177982 RepID=A0A7V8FKV8_9BURK|nr:MAG: Riboflavin transporter [Paracidovorax wautersii]